MPGVVTVARDTVGNQTDSALEFTGTSGKRINWAMRERQPWENYIGATGCQKKDKFVLFCFKIYLIRTKMRGKRRRKKLTYCPELGAERPPPSSPRSPQSAPGEGGRRGVPTSPGKVRAL